MNHSTCIKPPLGSLNTKVKILLQCRNFPSIWFFQFMTLERKTPTAPKIIYRNGWSTKKIIKVIGPARLLPSIV